MSDANKTDVTHQLDARGLKCPEPLMLVRNKIRAMQAGEHLRVRATDPTTTRDLQNFCRFMSHKMVSFEEISSESEEVSSESSTGREATNELIYVIEKGGA